LINPKSKDLPVAMKLILEADNQEYWLQKAIELLRETQMLGKISTRNYEENLSLATTLLTLCRYKNETDTGRKTKTRNNTTGKDNQVSKGS
jgi:hypothetical protein